MSPRASDCHFKEPIKIVFPLTAKGNKIFGSTIPTFNKDSNCKTRAWSNKVDVESLESSLPPISESLNEVDSVKPAPTKNKDSYCQICDVGCS